MSRVSPFDLAARWRPASRQLGALSICNSLYGVRDVCSTWLYCVGHGECNTRHFELHDDEWKKERKRREREGEGEGEGGKERNAAELSKRRRVSYGPIQQRPFAGSRKVVGRPSMSQLLIRVRTIIIVIMEVIIFASL